MFDYFSQPGNFAVCVEELPVAASADPMDAETLDALADALIVVELLHVSDEHNNANNLDSIDVHLRAELSRILQSAASLASTPEAREHITLRDSAFRCGDFEAARRYSATHELPFELILGPVPVSRKARAGTALSGVIAIPTDLYQVAVADIDAQVASLARELLLASGIGTVDRSFESPIYSICEVTAVAGEAARFPHHFANFLPEDEGIDGETYKTVVYANYYLKRFTSISLPLLRSALSGEMPGLSAAEHARILLTWFRAHDLAHSYFDNMCRRSGLQENFIHIAREVIADLIGFTVVNKLIADPSDVPSVLMAEGMRYARRDPKLFADTIAARFELGSLFHVASLQNLLRGDTFAIATSQLLKDFIGRLSNEDPASFQRWIETSALAYQKLTDRDESTIANDLVPIVPSAQGLPVRGGSFVSAAKCSHT
jgi:hypothetical protein